MGKNIFKKNMIIILGVALMCAGIIVYSFVRSYSSMNSFSQSGYIHTDPTISENKKLLFEEGEKYHPSLNNHIKFNDINDLERIIDSKTFIHYDDQSIASFSEGVIVDLDELNNGSTMSHYHMAANVSIEKQGTSYVAIANGQEITFTDFIWKLGESKYLVISPSILATLSEDDVRDVGSYAEVTFLDDRVIQIQTEDNIWQTISSNCSLQTANGSIIDLPMKNIKDEDDNVLLDFNKMVIDSNDNVEVAPLTDEEKALSNNKIPHFSVETEEGDPGLSGTTGTPGLIGSDGNYGVTGLQGSEGDSESVDNTVLKFPVFSVKDWNVTASSCSGKIAVTDEEDMLQPDNGDPSTGLFGQLYLVDLFSGSKIYLSPYTSASPSQFNFKDAASNETAIDFNFSGLQTDHSYMLCVSAPLKPDEETDTYSRTFISKTFWTDSLGVYMEAGEITTDTISIVINKDGNTSATIYRLERLYDNYESASSVTLASLQSNISSLVAVPNSNHEIVTYVNEPSDNYYKSNTSYYSILAYDLNNDHVLDDYSTQILEVKTLKQPASMGSPVLRPNRNNWGFDITPGSINDPDGGITKFVYEFYDIDQFTSSGDLVNNPVVSKTITTDSSSSFAISLDGVSLKTNTSYRVRATAYFDDNVTSYTLVSGFSGEARLDGATKPKVYFDTGLSSGVSTTSSYYDTITGTLHINPGTDGAKLIIDSAKRTNVTKVRITDSNSYDRTFDVLPITEINGKRKGDYLIGVVNESGDVSISFNDYESSEHSWVSGLKPNRDYEISVTGDLSEDGTTLIELNASIGKCTVKTAELEDFTIYSSYEADNNSEVLKNFTLAINSTSSSNAFTRQRATLYGLEVNVYAGDQTSAASLPTPIASKIYTVDDPWKNADGKTVCMYYDASTYPNGTYVVEVTDSSGLIEYHLANEYGVETSHTPITDGGVVVRPTNLKNSQSIVKKSVIDRLFNNQFTTTTLPDSSTDYIISQGGLVISADDFEPSQKNAIINVPDSGVTVIVNRLFDYTYNPNDWCKNNQQPSPYVNELSFTGEAKTFVQFSQDISDIVVAYPFATLTRNTSGYVDYYYELQAQFNNKGFLAESITYYVYDAVDFYKGSYTRSPDADSELIQFASTSTASSSDRSYLLRSSLYTCPVLEEGLELAKITVNIGTSATIPSVVFYPYTKNGYKARNSVSSAPNELYGKPIMYFPDGSTEKTFGHQYVFCWTINYHRYDSTNPSNDTEKLVYPFDASIKCKLLTSSISGHTPNLLQTYKFEEFANAGLANTAFDISGAYWNNSYRKYGTGCYMLIPHAEKTTDGTLCDEPIPLPETYAIQYDSNADSVTMKTFVVDKYGSVYQSSSNRCTPSLLKGTSGGLTVVPVNGSPSVVVKSLSKLPTNAEAVTSLISGNAADSTSIVITKNQLNTDGIFSATNGYAVVVIPIQLYSNKYTLSGSSIHGSGSIGSYMGSSSDGNWTFNPSNKNLYHELLTAKMNNTVDPSSYNQGCYYKYESVSISTGSPVSNYYTRTVSRVLTDDTQYVEGKTYYSVSSGGSPISPTVSGNNIKNPKQEGWYEEEYLPASGSAVSGTTYYNRIDAVPLQEDVTMEVYEHISTTSAGNIDAYYIHLFGPKAKIENAVGVRLLVGGKLKIDKYLRQLVSSDNTNKYPNTLDEDVKLRVDSGNIHMYFMLDVDKDLSTSVSEFGSTSFAGKNDVSLSASLLYETPNSGYGLLSYYLAQNDNNFSKTNNISFALKTVATNKVTSTDINYLEAGNENYLAYTTSTGSLGNPSSLYAFAGGNLSRFSSFLQMYGRTSASEGKAYLHYRSTRYWNTSLSRLSHEIKTRVGEFGNDNVYLPVKITEGGNMMIKLWDSAAGNYASGTSKVYLDIAGVQKSIENYSHNVVRQNAIISYSLHGTTPTDKLYFTISEGASTSTTDIHAYEFEPDNASTPSYYRLKVTSTLGYVTIPLSEISDAGSTNDPDAFLNTKSYKNAFIKVAGDSTQIDLRLLSYNTGYTVTCWEWTMISNSPLKYGFKKISMTNAAGSKVDNYYSFNTPQLEVPDKIYVSWFANAYDDKGISYSIQDDGNSTFDGDTMYYVIDLCDSSGTILTHLYADDTFGTFYFDADSLNNPSYNKIYKNDKFTIGHGADNKVTFTPNDPTDSATYFQDLKYGGSYILKFRLYEKGHGPAWNSLYDYSHDYDNILYVFYLNEDPTTHAQSLVKDIGASHEIEDVIDISSELDVFSGMISSTIEVNGTSAESYITFIVPGLTNNSYSIRYSKFTPVIVREHVNSTTGSTEYYDVTKDLLSIGGSGLVTYASVNGLYDYGQALRLNINELVGGAYVDKYEVGDVIHIFVYSYQDDLTGSVYLDSSNNISLGSELLSGRYTVQAVNSIMNATEYASLSDQYTTSSPNSGSRLMGQWSRTVTSADINAGKVTVAYNEMFGNEVLNVLFKEASGITSFGKAEYGLTVKSYSRDILGHIVDNSPAFWLPTSISMTLSQTSTPSFYIDITSAMEAIRQSWPANSTLTEIVVTLQFYDNKPSPELINITPDPTDSNSVVSPDNKKLTYTIRFTN